jgi:hypothetical protein
VGSETVGIEKGRGNATEEATEITEATERRQIKEGAYNGRDENYREEAAVLHQ